MIRPLENRVFVTDIDQGERTIGQIIIRNDDGRSHGIRDRWAKVYAVADNIDEIKVGQYILLKHGRWSRGIPITDGDEDITVYAIDYPEGVLVACDEIPEDWMNLPTDQINTTDYDPRFHSPDISNIKEY